eukprot:scaffold19863_cov52-Attheya_sp.AAC.3
MAAGRASIVDRQAVIIVRCLNDGFGHYFCLFSGRGAENYHELQIIPVMLNNVHHCYAGYVLA